MDNIWANLAFGRREKIYLGVQKPPGGGGGGGGGQEAYIRKTEKKMATFFFFFFWRRSTFCGGGGAKKISRGATNGNVTPLRPSYLYKRVYQQNPSDPVTV